MPRPPKNKAPEVAPSPAPVVPSLVVPALGQGLPVAQVPGGPPVIDVAQFIRVRDSVHQRLQTIQDLIASFSADYLRQTNLLIGEGTNLGNGAESLDHLANFGGLIPAALGRQPAVEEKKERKKRTHDPNAPKRPLTPYFLYMQTARPIIASDLGEQAPKGAVQEEGQRRWSVMAPGEKEGWNQAYQYNLRLYNARVHSYKHGNLNAKAMTDEEARMYAETYNIGEAAVAPVEDIPDEQDAIAEQLAQNVPAEVSASEEEEEEAAPVAKTPQKKKETRKRKSTAATPAAIEPKSESVATPVSPEAKKRKRTSKAAEQVVEEPKKSGRKKAKSG
ncbi:hypothetical protein QBC35DRAFT_514693 [Podospora australis]|uniref:HMG box domain-containing protein n=1 Tax=Podospora australis TaxID=1536484 RepID=A0AAN6WXW0_9PEZI|nr:hypothetical protein QBC35DRAFT_514693 [Podospora australis]